MSSLVIDGRTISPRFMLSKSPDDDSADALFESDNAALLVKLISDDESDAPRWRIWDHLIQKFILDYTPPKATP